VAVYLFFDESGNLDFSGTGTKFFGFGCLTTRNPASLLHPLAALRYDLLEQGVDLEYFHAAEDRQVVRNMVFAILAEVGGFDFDAVLIEKSKTPPAFHDPPQFYPRFARDLLTRVFERFKGDEKIILVTDRLPMKKKREAVEKALKSFLRNDLGSRPFTIVHHSSAAHLCLQAADYCMWAIYRKWSLGDDRSYGLIRPFVKSEVDILRTSG
jgi:hypothetical protein